MWINRGKIPTFKKWIELETYKEKIHEAVATGDAMFPKYILAYISTAYDVSIRWFKYLINKQARLTLQQKMNNPKDNDDLGAMNNNLS